MEINADFTARTLVRFADAPWTPSPSPGVERKMLDRIGGEVARATSLVRFAPGSAFAPHTHGGGEEYLVLEGTFQDESGDYPAGSYVRNPPTSRHTPAAAEGATIFVKLHQFDPSDRTPVHERTDEARLLFANAEEEVRIRILTPHEELRLDASGGAEIFLLDGAVTEAGDTLAPWDWLRLPPGSTPLIAAGPHGAKLWTKTGHLSARPPAAPA
ncbi:cupin domain-containing protein [Histidinibacterium lentulum]|uniref:Cupin n=1 Tax=Histidinibacterium lentulum TaxID=2480588 RepID=A0A3N2R1L9_9RHOB|nr:cupin domain-containing protein [Histidinibacterium lentulum]ROU01238.1 cupin [Histidinibacterium lentulum]